MQSNLNVSNWSVNDVINFLHNIGITAYDSSFRSNDIDGTALSCLTSMELKNDLGIKSLGHRKQIIHHIEKLQINNNSESRNCTEYAMTACISAALSSILTQHYKSNNNSSHHPFQQILKQQQDDDDNDDEDDDDDDNEYKYRIIRTAVSMATEAAKYIIHNQDRIINVINTNPNNREESHSIDNTQNHRYTNCRNQNNQNQNNHHNNNNKRVFALNSNQDPIDLTTIDTNNISTMNEKKPYQRINGNNKLYKFMRICVATIFLYILCIFCVYFVYIL